MMTNLICKDIFWYFDKRKDTDYIAYQTHWYAKQLNYEILPALNTNTLQVKSDHVE